MPKRKNIFGSRGDSDSGSDYCFEDDDDFAPKSKKKEKSKKEKKDKKKKESSKHKSSDGTKKVKSNCDDSIIVLDDDSGPGDVYSIKETTLSSPTEKSLKVTLERLSPESVNKFVNKQKVSEEYKKPVDETSQGKKEIQPPITTMIHQRKEAKSEEKSIVDENKCADNKTQENGTPKRPQEVAFAQTESLQETPKSIKISKKNEPVETDNNDKSSASNNEKEASSKRNLRETKARKNHVKFNPLQYVEPVKTPPLGIKVGLSRHSRPKKSLHPLLTRTSL